MWRQLEGDVTTRTSDPPQKFIMADGKVNQAIDKKNISYKWHNTVCKLNGGGGRLHVLPLLKHSDDSGVNYHVCGENRTSSCHSNSLCLTSYLGNTIHSLKSQDDPVWDSDNQEELLKLMAAWPCTTSNVLVKTEVRKHQIILSDECDTPMCSHNQDV